MMTPLAMFGLGVPELLIILAVVLLLFGGSRLAGLGKSTGRALKEFKEETKSLKGDDKSSSGQPEQIYPASPQQSYPPQPQQSYPVQPPSVAGPESGATEPQWQQPSAGGATNPPESDPRRDV